MVMVRIVVRIEPKTACPTARSRRARKNTCHTASVCMSQSLANCSENKPNVIKFGFGFLLAGIGLQVFLQAHIQKRNASAAAEPRVNK